MLVKVGNWGGGAVWRITSGVFPSNTYACEVDHRGGVALVDPGLDGAAIDAALHSQGMEVRQVVCTHGHFDHAGSAALLQRNYGCKVYLHRGDAKTLKSSNFLLMALKVPARVELPEVTWVEGESVVDCGGQWMKFLPAPGHTPGSCVLELGTALFTGDTLYARGVGLSRLPGEDATQLRTSIHRLWPLLTRERTLFPGHGEPSDGEAVRTQNTALLRFLEPGPTLREAP